MFCKGLWEWCGVVCQLWSSGFGISLSKASGALNGDKINMTMYYVLSQVPSLIHERGRPSAEKTLLENSLYFPDRCYEGHHTLYVDFVSLLFCISVISNSNIKNKEIQSTFEHDDLPYCRAGPAWPIFIIFGPCGVTARCNHLSDSKELLLSLLCFIMSIHS